jgi:hypothetical protein
MTKLAIKNFEFKGHPTKNKDISKAFQPKIKIFSENNTPLQWRAKKTGQRGNFAFLI